MGIKEKWNSAQMVVRDIFIFTNGYWQAHRLEQYLMLEMSYNSVAVKNWIVEEREMVHLPTGFWKSVTV